jgi:protein TonB
MSSHADILDRPDPLTKSFWTSFTMHVLVVGALSAGALVHRDSLNMGSPTGGGMGGMLVNPVSSIPLPNRGGPENPVANDTQSQVPTPPPPKEKAKAIPKTKAAAPDAVPLKSNKALTRRQAEAQAQPNKFREHEQLDENRLYSSVGQRTSSPMYQMPGGGGVGIGDSSPFGEQFGAYANIIRDTIARNWRPTSAGRTAGSPAVVITFTIQRNGAVTNVKISKTSGIQTMDFSAQRAVLDATLPPLPQGFPRSQADVEMKFELGN